MKIIDFRVRPPVRGILKTAMYATAPHRDRFTHQLGMQRATAAPHNSMPMRLKELAKSGGVGGVILALITNKLDRTRN